jgi:hypothetical protein
MEWETVRNPGHGSRIVRETDARIEEHTHREHLDPLLGILNGTNLAGSRAVEIGSLNIPPPSALNGGGSRSSQPGGMGRFEGPRSPPGRQSEFLDMC